jgi:signal transduction histidine kinase
MRWSLSTKVFLSLAAVIFAFSTVGLYSIYRMGKLRSNVELVRKGVLPLTSRLGLLHRELKDYERELSGTSRSDLIRLRSYFHNFSPFSRISSVERKMAAITRVFSLDSSQTALIESQLEKLEQLREGNDMRGGLETGMDNAVNKVLFEAPEARENQAVYGALARAYVAFLHEERFEKARQIQDELATIIRRVRKTVYKSWRAFGHFMQALNQKAATAESQAMLITSIATGIALIIALAIMFWVGMTLKPLKRLREGVKQVARGEFTAVQVDTSDEIGQLADEFNRMSQSLKERDIQLEKQRTKLLHAERLATIGKMSSQITHEIRNPLSSIGLNTELLEEEIEALSNNGQSAEARTLLGAIRGEIDRLNAVTEQYLRFARLPNPELSEEHINPIVTELLGFMSSQFEAAQITVTTLLADDLPNLHVDEKQIRQALINLLVNGIQSMEGGGTLTLTTEQRNGAIRIVIRDTGKGIDQETQSKIFEPFFSTKNAGTGLGLTLVQQIVDEHKGQISCESVLGQGTCFTIELPLGEGHALS